MEARLKTHLRTRIALMMGAATIAFFAFEMVAQAKCSIRVGDPLIMARYQDCKPREFLSYLYNDLVTPYSFTCAKKLSATCHEENCDEPKSDDEQKRCLSRYVEVLNECSKQIDDAARMARCKDTKAWPVEPLTARATLPAPRAPAAMTAAPTAATTSPVLTPGAPVIVPDSLESPVHVEELPVVPDTVQSRIRGFHTSQSARGGN
jgi:hypothetical protein